MTSHLDFPDQTLNFPDQTLIMGSQVPTDPSKQLGVDKGLAGDTLRADVASLFRGIAPSAEETLVAPIQVAHPAVSQGVNAAREALKTLRPDVVTPVHPPQLTGEGTISPTSPFNSHPLQADMLPGDLPDVLEVDLDDLDVGNGVLDHLKTSVDPTSDSPAVSIALPSLQELEIHLADFDDENFPKRQAVVEEDPALLDAQAASDQDEALAATQPAVDLRSSQATIVGHISPEDLKVYDDQQAAIPAAAQSGIFGSFGRWVLGGWRGRNRGVPNS